MAAKKSYFGSSLSIILVLITTFFWQMKVITLIEKRDIDVMSATMVDAIDYIEKFDASKGFFVSAAITAYDDETAIIEDPTYGELIFEHYGWGYDGGLKTQRREIEHHYCTDEELGIVKGPETVIFPLNERKKLWFETYRKKFKCINKSELVIWGDYDSP